MFGELVRALRHRMALTQDDLAARAGLGVRTVRAIEANRIARPRSGTVTMLADALGIGGAEREVFHQKAIGARAWEVGHRPRPTQLPPDVPGFAGRHQSLDRLGALLAKGGSWPKAVAISAIAGTAGVGKTALALHWAHRVADRFPDGQLYLNLRGFDPGGSVMSPGQAVRIFLDAMGVAPERIPAGLDAQVGLYRSLLAGRRALVVLDNARDSDQVRPLLPGSPGCLVVVTSRNDLSGLVATDGAWPLTVDVLSAEEAGHLLARRLGDDRVAAEPAAVSRIVEACAGLPLALAVVAARAQLSGFPLATIAAELDGGGRRLDALDTGDRAGQVRAVFSWSYEALSPAAARLFRLLGLHPGPDVSLSATASLAGVPVGEAQRLAVELVRASLVTEHAPDRYTFHDLLRVYASELTHGRDSDVDRRAALTRLLDHYVHTAHAADRLIDPLRTEIDLPLTSLAADAEADRLADHDQAIAWLATEHRVLLAVLGAAAESGFDRSACQLAWSLYTFYKRQGRWPDVAAAGRIALTAGRRLRHAGAQGFAHRTLSQAAMRLGRPDDAQRHLQEAIDLYAHAGDNRMLGITHQNLSMLSVRRWDLQLALHHAEQALALNRAAGSGRGTAVTLDSVGWCHAQLGNYAAAIAHCEEARVLFERLGDTVGLAGTWDSLGDAHDGNGEPVRAAECYRSSIALNQGLGDDYHRAESMSKLGDTLLATGEREAARTAWAEALEILTELDHPAADAVRTKLEASGAVSH